LRKLQAVMAMPALAGVHVHMHQAGRTNEEACAARTGANTHARTCAGECARVGLHTAMVAVNASKTNPFIITRQRLFRPGAANQFCKLKLTLT